jgi:outer membrane protein OmpA-like peptidoglycan-associated protein
MTRQAKYKKRPHRATRPVAKTKSRSAETGLQSELLALQRSAGNKVVSQLLHEGAESQKHQTNVASPLVDQTLSKTGQSLDSATRAHMESLFNEDFSNVRIHTDADAAESARSVNALAYTSADDVVFGANQYDPNSTEGSQLLAHELAHTVQQRDGGESAAAGATTISRAPIPGTGEPEPISLFSATIPAPAVTRMGDVIVATVYFGQNNFLLDSRNYAAVEKLSDELEFMFNPSIAVDGYASSEGTEANNQRLSENRRTTVMAIVRSKMKGATTFTGKGHGAADLAVEETGAKGKELDSQKALNRRVTIVIIPTSVQKAEEEKKKPFQPFPLPKPEFDIRPETDEERINREMKRAMKEADEKKWRGEDKKPSGQSFNEQFWKAVDKVVDDTTKKLGVPEKLRPYIKDGAHALIEKGTETVLDKALDQTSLNANEKEAVKKAIEAASKTKPQ